MKKKVAKELRVLAAHLPPVFMWVPYSEVKTGDTLNQEIDAERDKAMHQYEQQLASRTIVQQIKDQIKEHAYELGLQPEPGVKPFEFDTEYKESGKYYKRKSMTVKAVNHYDNLKKAWKKSGQTGITEYSKWSVMAYKEQQKTIKEHESNTPGETTPTVQGS